MNAAKTLLAVLVLAAVGAGGYWAGGRTPAASSPDPARADAVVGAASGGSTGQTRQPLYYRNPMGLADTSPTPKKDPMGMDYVPVYADEQAAIAEPGSGPQVRIDTDKVQKLGVRSEAAAMRVLARTVRASGRVEPDERRIYAIAPRFEGYVERLHVNVTGQPVARGQPLFEVYSPELVSAQREYVIAVQGVLAMKDAGAEAQAGMKQLAESSLSRLRNWDMSAEQIDALVRTGEARRTITFRSPVTGIVTEKKAVQGMRFMPGEALYQVTDLSSVWVMADVFEQDLGLVRPGARAEVRINAYPEQAFSGTVGYVYPSLQAATRTVPVRIELANPRRLLKPAMFAQVELKVGATSPVLAIPDSAVIDSGTRRIVLIRREAGRFEPREVELGARSDRYVEVRAGLKEGEQVVVAANFLIDAESNLQAAIGGMGAGPAAAPGAEATASSTASSAAAPAAAGHRAEGTVEAIDTATGSVSLAHGAIASLKWPAMTMDFKLASASLLKGLKPGMRVTFELVERPPGEWVITAIAPAASAAAGRSGR